MNRLPILIYTDDQRVLAALPEQLRLDGYEPHIAQARRQFIWALAQRRPAALVLGDLPTLVPTLALLRELRADETGGEAGVDPGLPVLVLSAAAGELCELRALEAGADDFQPVSVSYLVLRARLAALIARSQITRQARRLAVGPLRVDARALEASYAGRTLKLSKLEFTLLHELAREPRRVFTKDELLCQVWGYPAGTTTKSRTLDAHAARLRRKLAAAGASNAIESRRGVGYRLGLLDADPPSRRVGGRRGPTRWERPIGTVSLRTTQGFLVARVLRHARPVGAPRTAQCAAASLASKARAARRLRRSLTGRPP